jgi:hypothetical protein
MGKVIIQVIADWFTQSQIAKGTATVAMGSSIGFITIMGFFKEQIIEVRAETKMQIEQLEIRQLERMLARKEHIDYKLKQIDENYVYLRGAIDETNQNVLLILKDKKK